MFLFPPNIYTVIVIVVQFNQNDNAAIENLPSPISQIQLLPAVHALCLSRLSFSKLLSCKKTQQYSLRLNDTAKKGARIQYLFAIYTGTTVYMIAGIFLTG